MKIKFYISWERGMYYSEKELLEKVKETEKEFSADEKDEAFAEWLEYNYNPADIFFLTEEEKENIIQEYHEEVKERARQITFENLDVVELVYDTDSQFITEIEH